MTNPVRFLQVGVDRWKAASVNRAGGDILDVSGFAADGSDFTGFATQASQQWGPSKPVGKFIGRNYTYVGGTAMDAGGLVTQIANGNIVVADNAVSYIERTYAGVVSTNTTGFTDGLIPMAKVTAAANAITVVEDWRPFWGPLPYFMTRAGEVGVVDTRYPYGYMARHGVVGVGDETTKARNAVISAGALGWDCIVPPVVVTVKALALDVSVDLRGASRSATLKLGVCATNEASPIIDITHSDVGVYAPLILDGNKANQPADGFSDAFDTGGNNTGRAFRPAIRMKGTGFAWSGLTVEGVRFVNTYGAGVAVQDVNDVTVRHCTSNLCNFELVFIYSSNAGTIFSSGHTIVWNKVKNCGSGHATVNANGFVLSSVTDSACSHNDVNVVERNGVKLEWPNRVTCNDNTIANNSVDNFGGIQVQSSAFTVELHDNRIYNCGAGVTLNFGVIGRHVSVKDNLVEGTKGSSTADGINVGSGLFEFLTISDNTLRDIKRIPILVQATGTCKSLSLHGNNLQPQATFTAGGITLKATGGNWTTVNVGTNDVDHGTVGGGGAMIEFSSPDGSQMFLVECLGNTVKTQDGTVGIRETPAAVVGSGTFDGNICNGVTTLLGQWEIGPTNQVLGASASFSAPNTLAYSASITPRVTNGTIQVITPTNAVAFNITAPASGTGTGFAKKVRLRIKNTTGGAIGAMTTSSLYKLAAWVQPATGFHRDIDFEYDGANYQEIYRSPADIPN